MTSTDASGESALDTSDMFSNRDLEQEADTTNAENIAVTSGEDVSITEEGVYVISGDAADVTITVNADDNAKVQLVLDNVSITNEDAPAIYVVSADKVFVTTADGSTNKLSVTGDFATTDSETNVDGAIFSKDDITFNGKGTLTINSSDNGIVGKDDVKFTGGTYNITAGNHAIQGKDSVCIADGTFTLDATKDGVHAENSDDQTLGYVYIADGTFNIKAESDGIEGDAITQIDGGTFEINAEEGIEGTYVQINDGKTTINASDDGINATSKSTAYDVMIEINGGSIDITMGSGDTDALDSNGALVINGGTVNISAQFAFDYVTRGELNGGTVTVNGEQVTEITESMQMGGGMGGQGGRDGWSDVSGGSAPSGEAPDGGGFGGQAPNGDRPSGQAPNGQMGGPGKHGGHGPGGSNSGNANGTGSASGSSSSSSSSSASASDSSNASGGVLGGTQQA